MSEGKFNQQVSAEQPLADRLRVQFYRLAANGWLPANWFEKRVPAKNDLASRSGELSIEIVSHCWQYAHLLRYQLSSLVLYPPTQCNIVMTVFYSPQDKDTERLLGFFGKQSVENVRWHWIALPPHSLFRRSIGRNLAAKASSADWVWFTDCDLLFHEGCLDALSHQLQGKQDVLTYPREERTTALLESDNPLLSDKEPAVVDIEPSRFDTHQRTRATGPLQITHGDVARACGYCENIAVFQKPAAHWCKAHEDRVFRWLLRSQGTALEVPGVYRIRHIEKGRYNDGGATTVLRKKTRKIQSNLRGEEAT